MKAYKSVYNNLNNSKKSKNSSHSYNDSTGFYTSDREIKNKREELIRKYGNSSKKTVTVSEKN
jgi:hypothetical protein